MKKWFGYSADDMVSAIDTLLRGKTDVAGCVRLMDDYRVTKAGSSARMRSHRIFRRQFFRCLRYCCGESPVFRRKEAERLPGY